MCSPAAIPYVISTAATVIGSKMQSDAQNDAADKQQAAVNASLEQQDQFSQKAEQKALENADQYDAKDRLTKFDEARAAAGDSLTQQLVQSRSAAPTTSQPAGRMSQEFLTGSAKSKADQFEQSVNMAQLMGKVRGAGDMLTGEGYQNADYASQLGIIGRNAQGSAQAAQPGILAAGKVNSGKMALGGGIQAMGSSYLASNLGAGMNQAAGAINDNWMTPGTSNFGPTQGFSKAIFG